MRTPLFGLLAIAVSTPAFAQGLNIDVGINSVPFELPATTFAAGSGQAGTWNAVSGVAGTTALVNLAGAATPATIQCVGGGAYNFTFDNAGTTGDDQRFMDDTSDPAGTATWTISGLTAGNYILYTYAWAPDSATFVSNVSVAGSSDPAQNVGGAWPGGYVLGTTHALHHVTVAAGGGPSMTISVTSGFATLNGFQLVPDVPVGPGTAFCEPGVSGVGTCQCGNPNGAGVGCANTGSSGASLSAAGTANLAADATDPGTVQLTGNSMLSGSSCIFLQGDANIAAGTTFGAGIRCAGGQLLRLYIKPITAGSQTSPTGADRSISNRCLDLGSPIPAAATRYYQTYYRDPNLVNPGGGCPAIATFNISSGQSIVWN